LLLGGQAIDDIRRYTRRVRRAILFTATLSLALTWPLASGARPRSSAAKPAAGRDVPGAITLRVRYKSGPWATRLSVKLNKNQLNEFRVCGVWNWPAGKRFTCLSSGSKLPARTLLRMEQSPIAKAMKRDDSPGWGMLGISSDPVVKTPLSNTMTGNVNVKFRYLATLRDFQGKVLVTSNIVTFIWHS